MSISHNTLIHAHTLMHTHTHMHTRSYVVTGTHSLIHFLPSLHHHLEGMEEQRLIGSYPRGRPGGNIRDTNPQKCLLAHKQFKKVNGGQTLSGEASDRISMAQDINCAWTLTSRMLSSILSCHTGYLFSL